MTDTQTPERIWLTWEGPHEADHWFSLEAYSFDCPEQHEFIRLDLHAAVVAERDQLKAKLESVTKRLAIKARDLSQDARNHKAERVLVEIVQELEKHRA